MVEEAIAPVRRDQAEPDPDYEREQKARPDREQGPRQDREDDRHHRRSLGEERVAEVAVHEIAEVFEVLFVDRGVQVDVEESGGRRRGVRI